MTLVNLIILYSIYFSTIKYGKNEKESFAYKGPYLKKMKLKFISSTLQRIVIFPLN